MEHRIEHISARKLIGIKLEMSLSQNRTAELWQAFMPRRREIGNVTGEVMYSLQVYPKGYFRAFNPATVFDKWALVEVRDLSHVPDGMEGLELDGGLYAVFSYMGSSADGSKAFQYIFQEWLPSSGYQLDNRPHFEILGEKYKNDDPASEEEIWIPIRQ